MRMFVPFCSAIDVATAAGVASDAIGWPAAGRNARQIEQMADHPILTSGSPLGFGYSGNE